MGCQAIILTLTLTSKSCVDLQISSYRLEGHWEDGLNWLNISQSGQLSGVIPEGFEMGGANIVATHPMGDAYQWFNISLPLQRRITKEISVGDTWINIGEDAATNAIGNTTQSAIFHDGQYIYGDSSL